MTIHPDTLQFFDELYVNNNRDWFNDNKSRWDAIRKDFVDFTQALIDAIRPLDPSIGNVDGNKCVYRIHRDLRFTKDKRPYKTHIACFMATGGDRTSTMPGYYFQMGRQDEYQLTGNCTMGGGIWCPQPKALEAIRQEIFYNTEEFKSIIEAPSYKKHFGSEFWTTKKLSRMPKGYPTDWPDGELLRYKDYVSMYEVPQELLFTEELLDKVIEVFAATVPLNKFIQKALWNQM